MSPKETKQFKAIRDAEEVVTISLSQTTADRLHELARTLTHDLGFEVTLDNAVSWLVKQHNEPKAAPMSTVPPDGLMSFPGFSMIRLTPSVYAEVRGFMLNTQKIHAIKHVREKTSCGLKEAKDFVESIDWTK